MQQPFLKQIAQDILAKHGKNLDQSVLVFPNRRAGLFFRKYLAENLKQPIWSPAIFSMEDFVAQHSNLQLADRYLLIAELYKVYCKHLGESEAFDKFFYWGELLLSDFDDIDKYLIDAEYLFTNVSRQKELDAYFDYLTEEQKEIITEFWSRFAEHPSTQKKEFSKLWGTLPIIYKEFTEGLVKNNLAYSGLMYKAVANALESISTDMPLVFAGFNALTASEEKIIAHCLENGAEIIWDADAYYLEDDKQEAGDFMRAYRKKDTFAKSFEKPFPNLIQDSTDRIVKISAVSQEVGQAKLLGNHLKQLLDNKSIDPERTLVVLPDEHLLFPVLSAIPNVVNKVNVTMGFPMTNTPIYSLVDHLLELQRNIRGSGKDNNFYYKNVLNVLKHPLVHQLLGAIAIDNIIAIEKNNLIRISYSQFKTDNDIVPKLFASPSTALELIYYLKGIIARLSSGEDSTSIENEYAYQFYTQLNKLEDIVVQFGKKMSIDSFVRLFKQVTSTLRLPFTGEPLYGLQIMGVLETRNLDFDNVFILSMNEGVFPSQGRLHSFIPYNLRKAYGLPTYEHQDAIYAYLFYRLFQKSKRVHIYYNTEEGKTGGGELSRFVQQLVYESGFDIVYSTLSHDVTVNERKPINITKDQEVMERMNQLFVKEENKLTPSALNIYLDCRLKFYFKYVAQLYEYDEIQDDVDAAVLGNLLHNTMEFLYEGFKESGKPIEMEDLVALDSKVDSVIDKAFKKQYHLREDEKYNYEGRQLIAKEVVKKYVELILHHDKQYAPFEILGLESNEYTIDIPIESEKGQFEVGFKGIIDRIDRKGERVRVIDYKTGKDNKKIDTVGSLFDREYKNRNKAGMQTLLYALLYSKNHRGFKGAIIPGVLNVREMADEHFNYQLELDKEPINNATQLLPEYTGHLTDLLQEIFSPYVPFDQTDDESKCSYCPYKDICSR